MSEAQVIAFPVRDPDRRLLDKRQAAAMLHMSKRNFERVVANGHLVAVKPSGNPRGKAFFRYRDLERLLGD